MEEWREAGSTRVAAERARQLKELGYGADGDDEHEDGELVEAAKCYQEVALALVRCGGAVEEVDFGTPEGWPWDPAWWKPSEDVNRNLERAGALVCAEMDRVTRLKKREMMHGGEGL